VIHRTRSHRPALRIRQLTSHNFVIQARCSALRYATSFDQSAVGPRSPTIGFPTSRLVMAWPKNVRAVRQKGPMAGHAEADSSTHKQPRSSGEAFSVGTASVGLPKVLRGASWDLCDLAAELQ
jgi:hypothetical protein